MHRRHLLGGFSAVLAAGTLTRAGFAQTPEASPTGETREITHPRGVTVVPANPQRVLALGEEFKLADLLELGIKPALSSGKFVDVFVGIDPELTEGLVPFSIYEADLEAFTALQPDLILVPDVYIDYAPDMFALIGQIGPMVAVPASPVWQDDFRFLASIFGLEELADEKIATLEDEIEATAAELALDGQTATFATIYQESTDIALWLTNEHQFVALGIALGLAIEPASDGFEMDQNGRTYISMEQAQIMTGDTLIMLQTTGGLAVEEEASYTNVTASPIWQSIPAVQADRVFVIERVGFPGDVSGRRALLAEFRRIFS